MKRRSFLQVIAGAIAGLPLLSLLPVKTQDRTHDWIVEWQGSPRAPEPPSAYRIEVYDASNRFCGAKDVESLNQFSFHAPHGESIRVSIRPQPPTITSAYRL